MQDLNNILVVCHNASGKYLIYSTLVQESGNWRLAAFAGKEWFEREWTSAQVANMVKRIGNGESVSTFSRRFLKACQAGEVHVLEDSLPSSLTVIIDNESERPLTFDGLTKATIQGKSDRTKALLFDLAEDCQDRGCRFGANLSNEETNAKIRKFEEELADRNRELQQLRGTLATQSASLLSATQANFTNFQPKLAAPGAALKRKKGASIVNPRMRMREAKGTEFEDDD